MFRNRYKLCSITLRKATISTIFLYFRTDLEELVQLLVIFETAKHSFALKCDSCVISGASHEITLGCSCVNLFAL